MNDRELIEMAYKAMDSVNDFSSSGGLYRGIFDGELKHLKKRLVQGNFVMPHKWQGLTDDEIEGITARVLTTLTQDVWPIALSRAIEAKLKEKNG
jgi:hypothetical protein